MRTLMTMAAFVGLSTSALWAAQQPTPAEIAAAHAKLLQLVPRPKAAAAAPASVPGWYTKICLGSYSLTSSPVTLTAVPNSDAPLFFSAGGNAAARRRA
jgi:hypothetical protein